MSSENIGVCALCKQEAPLDLSHIVPAFIGKYLKETSATGFLRSAENPNLRVQDSSKERLLCRDCEQRFSRLESSFAGKYLEQLQCDHFRSMSYDEDLYRFALSIGWRVLSLNRTQLLGDYPDRSILIDNVLENWRLYLIAERRSCATSIHLFVFSGIPEEMPTNVPPKTLHYMLRAIDATAYHSDAGVGVYVKLLRSCLFIPISPSEISGMKNTRVHRGNGRIVSPQVLSNARLGNFLTSRVQEAFSKPMSPEQHDKIRKTMERNPDRALRSESFRVAQANAHFGLE